MNNFNQFGIFLVLTCSGLIAACAVRVLRFGMNVGRMLQAGTIRIAINRERCIGVQHALVLRRWGRVCTVLGSFGLLLTLFLTSLHLTVTLAGAVTLVVYGVLRLVRKYKGTENTKSLYIFFSTALCAGVLSLMYARPLIGAAVIGFVIGYTNYYFDQLQKKLLQL